MVQQLRLANGRDLPLRAGAQRQLEAVPFTFEATDTTLSIRDVGELLGDAGSAPEGGDVGAYLGVVPASEESQELPKELLDRLRALGYLN